MSLQTILHHIELEVEGFLSLLLALHSDVAILLATGSILSLVCITGCKESNLTDILLLAILLLLVYRSEERLIVCIEECTPILQYLISLIVLGCCLTRINELNTSTPYTASVVVKLRSNLTLSVRKLVVLVALNSIDQCIVSALRHSSLVYRVVLLHDLIGLLDALLVVELLHSEINELVVSLGLLCIVSHLTQILLNQSLSLGISLSLHDCLESVTIACEC